MPASLDSISEMVHETLRAWARLCATTDFPAWSEAPEWMHASTRASVEFVLEDPDAGPGAQHAQWMAQKRADSWVYGEVRDNDRKVHPLLVPFEDLPETEQIKDRLLIAITKTLSASA